MLQKIIVAFAALLVMAGLFVATPQRTLAACGNGDSIRSGIDCAPESSKTQTVQGGIRTAVNTLLFVIGVAAVIVLIVGGFRFVLAGGNAQTVASARDTILYAVIGIVVALLA